MRSPLSPEGDDAGANKTLKSEASLWTAWKIISVTFRRLVQSSKNTCLGKRFNIPDFAVKSSHTGLFAPSYRKNRANLTVYVRPLATTVYHSLRNAAGANVKAR